MRSSEQSNTVAIWDAFCRCEWFRRDVCESVNWNRKKSAPVPVKTIVNGDNLLGSHWTQQTFRILKQNAILDALRCLQCLFAQILKQSMICTSKCVDKTCYSSIRSKSYKTCSASTLSTFNDTFVDKKANSRIFFSKIESNSGIFSVWALIVWEKKQVGSNIWSNLILALPSRLK